MARHSVTKAVNGKLLLALMQRIGMERKVLCDRKKPSEREGISPRLLIKLLAGESTSIGKIQELAKRLQDFARKEGIAEFSALRASDLYQENARTLEDITNDVFEKRRPQITVTQDSFADAFDKLGRKPLMQNLLAMQTLISTVLLHFVDNLEDADAKQKLADKLDELMSVIDLQGKMVVTELRRGSSVVVVEMDEPDVVRLIDAFDEGYLDHLGLYCIGFENAGNQVSRVLSAFPNRTALAPPKSGERFTVLETDADDRPMLQRAILQRGDRSFRKLLYNRPWQRLPSHAASVVCSAISITGAVLGNTFVMEWLEHSRSIRLLQQAENFVDDWPYKQMATAICCFYAVPVYFGIMERKRLFKAFDLSAFIIMGLTSLYYVFWG